MILQISYYKLLIDRARGLYGENIVWGFDRADQPLGEVCTVKTEGDIFHVQTSRSVNK